MRYGQLLTMYVTSQLGVIESTNEVDLILFGGLD